MTIEVGCCGYPVSMKKYRDVFKVVELNRTFYRYPKDSTVEKGISSWLQVHSESSPRR
ncbi:MAG: hypothetical protein OEZ48_07940 [Candidatus Bathyarchaeota archaeon]|nr:hypothetical protein [Candidatus Bathyarchaeota archaeon]